MNGELSGGLSRLATAGNRIVRASTSETVLLRGVNRSGLEYSEPDEDGFLSAAGLSRYEIRWIAQHWKANIIRVPFNQDWVLRGRRDFSAEDYLADIDQLIAWVSAYGMYTLLDLQWINADTPFGPIHQRQFVPPLPNPESLEMWSVLARRYKDEPAVLYDVFNEPHDRAADDPFPLWKPDGSQYPAHARRVSNAEWHPWARALAQAVRDEAPDSLLFLSGTNWAYDLRGFPLDIPNTVYSTHVYSNKGTNWDEAFGNLAYAAPVFAGEWGGPDADLEWGQRLARYFDQRAMGWAAWSWNDNPRLTTRYGPTPFGDLVLRNLSRNGTIPT